MRKMIETRSALFIIGLLFTGGLGYYVGYAPIPALESELSLVQQNNTILDSQIITLLNENQQFKNQLETLLENLTIQNAELQTQIEQLQETNLLYSYTLLEYNDLLVDYIDLLQEYQGTPSQPQGKMVVTLIPGVANGDWSNGNEDWLTQGMSNLVGGVKYLHEYPSGTFTTQSVNLNSKNQGIQFDVKPQPFGAEITLQVSTKGIVIFEEQYTGANSLYDWETVVIPFNYLMTMREQYGFGIEDYYDIRFTVLPGENTGSNIGLDNVSLVEITYE